MPKYTLKYFDARARGEVIRLLLALKGVDFEDQRVSFESWPAEKPKTPCGQLPVLTIDGKVYTESIAIQRYLAREFDLYGSNNQEGYEIDQVIGICVDLFNHYVKYFFEKDDKKKEELKKIFDKDQVPMYIGNLNKLMSKKEGGYCLGRKLSLADLVIFNTVDKRLDEAVLSKYPAVKTIRDNVKSHNMIEPYLKRRNETPV